MSLYQTTQELNHINSDVYDDGITVNVAAHEFIATTSNTIEEGASQRVLTVEVMTLDGVELPSEATTNSGAYIRTDAEDSVKVNVMKDGTVVSTNTTVY